MAQKWRLLMLTFIVSWSDAVNDYPSGTALDSPAGHATGTHALDPGCRRAQSQTAG
jgi:hypothetical protein